MKNKPSLVFIPGWGSDQRCWKNLEPLLEHYFDCSHYEFPYDVEPVLAWQHQVECLAEQIPDESVIVAWSLGGMLATQLAARFPKKVKALVLIATNPSFIQRQSWLLAMDGETFDTFCSSFTHAPERTISKFNALQAQGYPERKQYLKYFSDLSVINEPTYESAAAFLEYLREIDNTDTLFEIRQPVLNIFAQNDALVPVDVLNVIENKSTSCEKDNILNKCIECCGHAPHVSHAQLVFDEMSDFLGVSNDRYFRDKKRVADSFSKASRTYDSAAKLQRKVADKLCAWSHNIKGKVLDIGCGTGYCTENLIRRDDVEHVTGLDIAFDMLFAARKKTGGEIKTTESNSTTLNSTTWCNADLDSLPFSDACLDNVISSLAIQWSSDLTRVFSEVYRVLSSEGRFIVSSLGPDTLNELNRAWQSAEPDYIHVNRFEDATVVMDVASKLGFEVELFSVEHELLRYGKAVDLMRDLKAIGAHNINQGSPRGLTGKKTLLEVEKAYDQQRMEDDFLPASYQVYYWIFKKRRVLS